MTSTRSKRPVPYGTAPAYLAANAVAETDDCILWPFRLNRGGYGLVTHEGVIRLAHRVMCELVHGPPPARFLDAAHSCGHRSCINHRHLRWATRTENNADKIGHGTVARGSRHGRSKLTEADVCIIRMMLADGVRQATIAEWFKVTQYAIRGIAQGTNWGWLA